MNAYEGSLNREIARFDKIAEACRYYCRMIFPELIEQDDRIVLVFEEGQRFIIKESGESDDVGTLRLSLWLDRIQDDLTAIKED